MAVLDLENIKNQVKSALDSANTLTASQDLSSGLETRVQQVLTVNPARIPIQASWYPFVTVYLDGKSMEEATMQGGQSAGRRKATLDLKIVGAVWNSTISDDTKDDADNDCECLMENIEEIMRGATKLGGAATWSFPTEVTFHNRQLDEGSSLRVGIMNYQVTVFY